MIKLNEKQRKILARIDDVYPENESSEKLHELGIKHDLKDIKLLEELNLAKVTYFASTDPNTFEGFLKITPHGKEKLQETFITKIYATAYNNPWVVISIIVTIIFGSSTIYFASENFNLQNQVIQDNELKQTMPPTVWLTQEFRNGSSGELEIIPTLYFKKNSDRLFTISDKEINVTLNGKRESISGGGYPLKFRNEGISEGKIAFSSFYPASINDYIFFHAKNDLIIDYFLEIKDMDSQIRYRGNVTTEIDSTVMVPKSFPSGYEPIIFNWTKV